MDEHQSYEELNLKSNIVKEEREIDLIDILHKIILIRKILYKAAFIGLVLGLIIALSIPKKYTVKVALSPEMGNGKEGGGLAGLAASFLGSGSAAMGDGIDALNVSLSSDIVSSTPFLLELFSMEVPSSSDMNEKMTLESYLDEQSSPWWIYVVGFPSELITKVKLLLGDEKLSSIDSLRGRTIELTKEEFKKIDYLKKNIIASVDKKTAITSISVTLQNPQVTAIVADSVIRKLQEYITDYRTFKAKENCVYLEKLFEDRQKEYYIAQKKYANYVDTHDNLILQSVHVEQERLQNEMSLAYQVYSQVANQLQVARAKVQEEKPVFAIVEPAVIPLKPSGIGIKIYVLFFMLISVSATIGWYLIGKNFLKKLKKEIKG
ncbi:chain-length determining protein [Bacteroides bouchesdurhonensis]|uniref:chain-length determining protein n=1 Tax=Bacteroides bouchesdurhonensis TaxID=1841855 RepID=UPI00097F70CB|nr:chain-length determining protein [Bacteroides bouchesdurhonensis]